MKIANDNVVLGMRCTSDYNNCVLIGTDLIAERDNQVKIGNSEVIASRQITDEEFLSIKEAIGEIALYALRSQANA